MSENMVRRSHIIVKRKLQIKYAAVILVSMLVTAITVGADFYIRLHGFIGDFIKDLPDRNIEMLMVNMNQLMYAKLVVLILIAVAVSLYISHKFAGPLVHIEKSLDKLAEGNLNEQVYFRSGDELKHLAKCFNYMISRIKTAVSADKKKIDEAKMRLEALKGKVVDESSKESIEAVISSISSVGAFWRV